MALGAEGAGGGGMLLLALPGMGEPLLAPAAIGEPLFELAAIGEFLFVLVVVEMPLPGLTPVGVLLPVLSVVEVDGGIWVGFVVAEGAGAGAVEAMAAIVDAPGMAVEPGAFLRT